MEKRISIMQRAVFSKALQDLRDILQGYDKLNHYSVIMAYIKSYNIELTASAKGRLLYMLGTL